MPDNHYVDPKLAAIYDLDSPWSVDRDFYLSLAGPEPIDILDLGCGTGLLCDAYAAQGHRVTGADPSPAMLDVARRKSHGANIEWVCASAQDLRSDKRFDLIVMTGHAFQVLLEDKDILAALAVMRAYLKADGRIVFETRNPEIDWPARWHYDMEFDTPFGTMREVRRHLSFENNRLRFNLEYSFPDDEMVSHSELRFATQDEIAGLLQASGLVVAELQGDWDGGPFDEDTSEEMIFTVRRDDHTAG